MAAPFHPETFSKFCPNLFNILQKTSSSRQEKTPLQCIIASRNDITYVWDDFCSCLRISNERKEQTLLCSNPPMFKVNTIVFNDTARHVALVGDKGIAAVELPSKYGSEGLYMGGKDKILCRSVLIDERFFSTHKKETVRKVVWHPGSPNGSHLCVLCSDDVLRIYNIAKPDSTHQLLRLSTSGGSKYSAALGESFVSMSFGEVTSTSADHQSHSITWPLYLLTGMGSVHQVDTTLYSARQLMLSEPLKMLPMSEDNYGTDACDILYINSSPGCLVISTTSGSLIHCLILPHDHGEASRDSSDIPVLYVYDIVKLELLLTVPTSDEDYDNICDEEDFTSHVLLVSDPMMTDRYHCMHSAGVHTITLKWMSNIQHYLHKDDGAVSDEESTRCQHVICTRPLADCKPSPVRGLAIIPLSTHTTSIVCLLSDYTCIQVCIRNESIKESSLSLTVSDTSDSKSGTPTTDRREFIKHIEDILRKETTTPLIKTGTEQSLTPEQSYKILCRATKVFREEYLHKLELARGDVDRRLNSLRMLKDQQLMEVKSLHNEKSVRTDVARDLAEKYEDVCERNESLVSRMEKVMIRIQHSISGLSDAERSLSTELQTRQTEIDQLKSLLDQIKKKNDYQRESMKKRSTNTQTLSDAQLKRINTVLCEESEQISELVNRLQGILSATQ